MSESNHWSRIDNYLSTRAVNLSRVISEQLCVWQTEALDSLMEEAQNILRGQQTCLLCQMFSMVVEEQVAELLMQ